MKLIENLNWRYATKLMSNKKVPAKKLSAITDAIQLSASSFGLQPYTILIVKNPRIKTKLQAAAYGQRQLSESSHVLVFCTPKSLSSENIATFIQSVADTRGIPVAVLKGYQDQIEGTVSKMSESEQQVWFAKQAYIALGTALVAAAEQKVDACPMEGFSRPDFDKILDLDKKGLMSTVILALGYRSEEDKLASAEKVRKDKAVLFQMV